MGKEYYTRPRDTFPTRLRRTTEQTRPDGSATEAKASAIDPSGLFLNEETSVSDYSEFMPQFPPPQRKLLGERSPTLSTSENTSHFVVSGIEIRCTLIIGRIRRL